MLMIRLQRVGRKNVPHFRVLLTDKKNSTKSGKFLEILGSYDAGKGKFEIKTDRVKHWLAMGARPSDTMHNFLVDQKLVSGKKINVLPKKRPIKKEAAETPVMAPETPAPVEEVKPAPVA